MQITRKLKTNGAFLVDMLTKTTTAWHVVNHALPGDATFKGFEFVPGDPRGDIVILVESGRWPENCPDELESVEFKGITLPP